MTKLEIAAQSVGIVAMALNIISFQFKKQKTIIFFQLLVSTLFSINFLMLGATMGGILNIIGIARATVFMFKEKMRTDRPIWLVGFVSLYLIAYVLSFTVFGKEPSAFNLMVEFLPVIGMTALTVGFGLKSASQTRKCALINSPAWLVYNVIVGSWGAIACEVMTLVSVVFGIVRHDKLTNK